MRSIKLAIDNEGLYSFVTGFINLLRAGSKNRLKDFEGNIKLVIYDDSVYSLFIGFINLLPSDQVKILKDFDGGFKSPNSEKSRQKIEKSYDDKNEYSEDEAFQIIEKALNENCL